MDASPDLGGGLKDPERARKKPLVFMKFLDKADAFQ